MISLTELWLPILLSAVIVFLASSIIHMALPWHKGDYRKIPNEDKFLDAVRSFAIPPGDYMAPRPGSSEEMKSPEFAEKCKKGPMLMTTIFPPGSMAMGKSLVLWFLYCIAVGIFAAYVTSRAVMRHADYLEVFRFAGVTAFLTYAGAQWPMSIWYRRSWLTTIKHTIDGLIFGCLTAGTFGWLWPR